MALKQIFEPQFTAAGWFSPQANDEGWFDSSFTIKGYTVALTGALGLYAPASTGATTNWFSWDPSFEAGVGLWSAGGGAVITQDSTHVYSGSNALKVVWPTAGAGFTLINSTTVSGLDATKTYTMSLRYWQTANNGLVLQFGSNYSTNGAATGGWAVLTNTFTGLSAANTVIYPGFGSTSGDTVWIDGLMIEEGSIAHPYYDGSTPGAKWAGSANATSSSLFAGLFSNIAANRSLTGGLSFNVTPYVNSVLADGPSLYWRLGEASGTSAIDASGNSRTGTYNGSPTLGVTGLSGDGNTAASFTGNTQYVDISHGTWLDTNQQSHEFLISLSSTTSLVSLISRDDGGGNRVFSLYTNSGSQLEAYYWDASGGGPGFVTGSTNLSPSTTYLVELVWDGTNVWIYLNGVLDGSNSCTGGLFINTTDGLTVANNQVHTGSLAGGTIDEYAFYGYALSAAQIAARRVSSVAHQPVFVRNVRKALAAVLSFVGAVLGVKSGGSTAYTSSLSGGLSYAGSMPKRVAKQTTGGLSFVGALARRAGKALAGGLSFAGTRTMRYIDGGFTAALSFTGSQTKAVVRALTGALSFTGSVAKRTARALAGGVSFTGSIAASKTFVRALTGALSFTGSRATQASKGLTAGLSFTGSQLKRSSRNLAAGLSFTGSFARGRLKLLTGGLSFNGGATGTPTVRGSAWKGGASTTQFSIPIAVADYDVAPQAGDLLVAFVGGNNSNNNTTASLAGATVTAGTGWTNQGELVQGGLISLDVFTRTATGTSADNVTFTETGDGSGLSTDGVVVVAAVSGVGAMAFGAVTLSPTTASQGSTGDLLLFAGTDMLALSTPAGMTQIRSVTGGTGSSQFMQVAKQLLGTPGTRTTTGGGNEITVAASFTGTVGTSPLTKITTKTMSGGLSYAGSLVRLALRNLAAGLSFTGSQAKRTARALTGALSFTGALATGKALIRALTGALSFTGTENDRTSKSLSGGASFTGSQTKKTSRLLAGGLSFAGSIAKPITKGLSAALSFTGSLPRQTFKALSGVLTFLGNHARVLNGGGTAYTQGLSATLSFVGSSPRRITRALAGALSFTGSFLRTRLVALAGALSFTGSVTKSTQRTLAGGLSFTGSQARKSAKSLAAGLNFVGSQAKAGVRAFAGSLSFTGSQSKTTNRSIAGGLSFTGAISRGLLRALSGALSFTGSVARRTGKVLAGALSFVGSLTGVKNGGATNYTQNLTAALSFVGSRSTRVARALASALSFVGARGALVARSLSAALSFTGSFTKQAGKNLTAGLSFAGSQVKRATKVLAGTLSYVGTLNRAFPVRFTAALSFIGTTTKQTRRALSGALSFAGSLAPSRLFIRALSASLSFTGSQSRRIGKAVVGALSFIPGFTFIAHILNPAPEITHPDVVVTSLSGGVVVTQTLASVDGTDHAGSLVMASTGTSVAVTSVSGDIL